MKAIIVVLLTAILMSNKAYAQKISANKVPAAVLSGFKAKFPNVTRASWEMENENKYEANFKLNSNKTSVCFTNNGEWIETESEIKVSALPAKIQATLAKDFTGFKVDEVSMVESAKNGSGFEAEIEKADEEFEVLFSADGQLISKTKEQEEKRKKD